MKSWYKRDLLECIVLKYDLFQRLVPVYEKEIREAGPDSWVAYFLDVSNNVPITPLLLSSIVNRLSHRK
jgi:hypothetical protein